MGELIEDLMKTKVPPPFYYHIQEFLTKVCVPFYYFIYSFYGIQYLCFYFYFLYIFAF